jgi:predicted DNA-binding transcriptional regulator AlpA
MARVRKRLTQKTVLMMTGFNEAALNAAVEQGTFPALVHVGKKHFGLLLTLLTG